MSGGGKAGVPYLNANSLGVNPWPMVNAQGAKAGAGMANMYSDLGVGTQGGPGSPMTQDLTTTPMGNGIGAQTAAEGTQLSLENQNLQTSELQQLAQMNLAQQQQGIQNAGALGGLAGLIA